MTIYNINESTRIAYICECADSKCYSLHAVYHWIKQQDEIPVYSTGAPFADVLAARVGHNFLL